MEDCRDRILSALFRLLYLSLKQFVIVHRDREFVKNDVDIYQKTIEQCKQLYEMTGESVCLVRLATLHNGLEKSMIDHVIYEEEYRLLPEFIYQLADPLVALMNTNDGNDQKKPAAADDVCICLFLLIDVIFWVIFITYSSRFVVI